MWTVGDVDVTGGVGVAEVVFVVVVIEVWF